MSNVDRDPMLLTPGPLTTTLTTKAAMLRDWGSWDASFNAVTARVRERLTAIVNGRETHVCVPMQGSGTFSVEGAVNTLVPRDGHVLVLINGAYGKRLARLTEMMGRKLSVFEIADVVAKRGRSLIVDAMSSFGAIPIDAKKIPFDALIAASGKCIEGPPGMGFVFVRRTVLEQYIAAGGQPARYRRYAANCETLISGMTEMGFKVFLDARIQAPIIVTFHAPADPKYAFKPFYDEVRNRGFILYPGKLTELETFRVGCIGAIGPEEMRQAVNAVRDSLRTLGINVGITVAGKSPATATARAA